MKNEERRMKNEELLSVLEEQMDMTTAPLARHFIRSERVCLSETDRPPAKLSEAIKGDRRANGAFVGTTVGERNALITNSLRLGTGRWAKRRAHVTCRF